jgi:hypothetical protein
MRGPDKAPRRSAEEIAHEIILKLGAGRTIEVEQIVRRLINNLRQIKDKPPEFGNRTENLEYLQELRNDIERLRKTLGGIPNDSLFLTLFAPELKIRTPDSRVSSHARALDTLMEDAEAQYGEHVLLLEGLGDRCAQIADARPGKHKHFGQQQFRAALAARVLMAKAGKKPTSGTWQSLYRRLATLFYEAMTDEPVPDMKRACDEVLRLPLRVSTENVQKI